MESTIKEIKRLINMSALYNIGLCLKTPFPHYKKANEADKQTHCSVSN